MTLMEYYDKVKSKLAALERDRITLVETCIVDEIASTNGHDAPIDADRPEAHGYVVAVRFVLQSNYPKYIAELSSDQLDHENKYPRSLASAYEILYLHGPEFSRPEHQAGVAFTNVGVQPVPGDDGCVYPHGMLRLS